MSQMMLGWPAALGAEAKSEAWPTPCNSWHWDEKFTESELASVFTNVKKGSSLID